LERYCFNPNGTKKEGISKVQTLGSIENFGGSDKKIFEGMKYI
jgi:hypothetical protein